MKNFLIAAVAVFAPVQVSLLTAISLICLDFCLGVGAAYKKGEPITSSRMRDTLGKVLAYESLIVIAFILEHFLTQDSLPCVKVATTYIAIVEGTSLLENLSTLTGQNLTSIIAKINSFKE